MIRTLAATLLLCAAPAGAQELRLALPVDCALGQTCFIQNYMDRDPGPGAADFACGPLSYDGHEGTDFALPSLAAMQAGVDVLAAAPGTVTGVRDGMDDRLFTGDAAGLDGRDCGNGLIIDHGGGWESQYCHMKQGSLRVGEGQRVETGAPLGQIGLSGRTQFPHLHLSLRKRGLPVDPFRAADSGACGAGGPGLWIDRVPYVPGGLIAAGFAPGLPEFEGVKAGTAAASVIAPEAGALVLWGYAFGAQSGDRLQFDFDGQNGLRFSQTVKLARTQAHLFRATGKRRTQAAWPVGAIHGSVRMIRDGEMIASRTVTARIAP